MPQLTQAEWDRRGNELLRKVWHDFERIRLERHEAAAQADPKSHRDTTVFARGVAAGYRYWQVAGVKRGEHVNFCYAKNRNAAGYYLSWIEVINRREARRSAFLGHETKKTAIELCRARAADAKRPKEERKYVLPTIPRPKKRKPS